MLIVTAPAALAQTTSDATLARVVTSSDGVESAESSGAQRGVYGFEKSANEFGVWGGGSFSSPTLIGTTEGTRLAVLALRFARVLARGDSLVFKYTVDAVPVASLSFPKGAQVFVNGKAAGEAPLLDDVFVEPGKYTVDAVPVASLSFPVFETFGSAARERRKTITGAGLSPVGFQLNFRRRERVQPFVETSGGFVYFGERVPEERGAQFNFTADFGGGVQWKAGTRRAWTAGYRYQHISNGYRAQVNPGFDSNLFYFGFSIFR